MYICADADAYEAEALHENIFTSAHLPALSEFECGFVSSTFPGNAWDYLQDDGHFAQKTRSMTSL